jgi:hypothetical protein
MEFLIALRGLMDFRYLCQFPVIDDDDCDQILAVLKTFHDYKHAILSAGVRVGTHGKQIDHFYIPKLEFMQSVVPNIRANGVPLQWSADVTEHCHITEIKNPARAGNNKNYESQICRYLDRQDKCQRFDLATAVREAQVDFRSLRGDRGADDEGYDSGGDDHYPDIGINQCHMTSSLLAQI